MFLSLAIILLSLVMFVYWFRSSCLLILQSRFGNADSQALAEANQLSFDKLEGKLAQAATAGDLDQVCAGLDRDLQVVQFLLRNCEDGCQSLESKLLLVDYRVMQFWYSAMRPLRIDRAQNALREMGRIVSYLTMEAGECVATSRA